MDEDGGRREIWKGEGSCIRLFALAIWERASFDLSLSGFISFVFLESANRGSQ